MLYLTVTSFYSRSLNCFRMECCYCLDLDRINENELDQTKRSERVKNWHWIVKVSMERVNNRQTIESKHHSDKCRLKLYTFVIITHTIYDQNKLPSTAKSRQLKLQPKIAWWKNIKVRASYLSNNKSNAIEWPNRMEWWGKKESINEIVH